MKEADDDQNNNWINDSFGGADRGFAQLSQNMGHAIEEEKYESSQSNNENSSKKSENAIGSSNERLNNSVKSKMSENIKP